MLKQCAGDMRTITYRELGKRVDLAPNGLAAQLKYIHRNVCLPTGLPDLTVLVVTTEQRRPAEGGFPSHLVRDTQAFESWWRGNVIHVYVSDWSEVELGS